MTPMELIEDGLRSGNLRRIADGYAAISGVSIDTLPAGTVLPPEAALAALRWYADRANYELGPGRPLAVVVDGGARARDALGGVPADPAPAAPTAKKPPRKGGKARPRPAARVSAPPPAAPEPEPAAAPSRPPGRNWDPPAGNQFRDRLTDAAKDRKVTKWINENVVPVERRDPFDDPEVDVRCDACGRAYKARRSEVRVRRGDAEAEIGEENVCPRCILGGGRG